jgi:transposase
MDNARIHHGDDILRLVERFGEHLPRSIPPTFADLYRGVRIEYLPPYSPDLNPIEEAFSKVKAFIRRYGDILLHEGDGLLFDLMELMDIITEEDAIGYIMHAGYF